MILPPVRCVTALIALSSLAGCPPPDGPADREQTLTPDAPFLSLRGGGAADDWDLRLDGWRLFLNGGESGGGLAGGIDMELLDLELRYEDLLRRNQIVYFFFYDSYGCALSDWWWYALDGTHTLFSNYHVYGVRRGERLFAWQMLDYYRAIDGASVAGYPEFRWAEVDAEGLLGAPAVVDLDATAGGLGADPDDPLNRWTYFSFDSGLIDVSDGEAGASAAWDLAFKRFDVKSNSGPSGPAGVVTLDFDLDRAETPDDVLGFTPANEADRFEARAEAFGAAPGDAWTEDDVRPVVDRWLTGRPGAAAALDPDRWFLVGDRDGEALAKLRIVGFEGSDPAAADAITVQWAVFE